LSGLAKRRLQQACEKMRQLERLGGQQAELDASASRCVSTLYLWVAGIIKEASETQGKCRILRTRES